MAIVSETFIQYLSINYYVSRPRVVIWIRGTVVAMLNDIQVSSLVLKLSHILRTTGRYPPI